MFGCSLTIFSAVLTVQAESHCKEVHWERLDLNAGQRAQMTTLDNQWHSLVGDIAPRITANEKRLHAAMASPTPDETEIMALERQIHNDKTQLRMQATQIFLQKRKLLTPEQQARLVQMLN